MARIKLENASVEFEILGSESRSLKKQLFKSATGGRLKTSNNKTLVKALSELNFTIDDGEKVALIGHNGAGKSTLLRTLTGIYVPTSGKANIEGKVSSLIDISLGMDQESTGLENIYIRSALLGLTKKETMELLDEIIEFSDLGEFIHMPIRTYSSGMSMRLAFSISTILEPEILIMDEWLSVGDENFIHKAEERMNSLLEKTKILIIASHSFELIKNTCTRALVLNHGSLVYDGPVEEAITYYQGLGMV